VKYREEEEKKQRETGSEDTSHRPHASKLETDLVCQTLTLSLPDE